MRRPWWLCQTCLFFNGKDTCLFHPGGNETIPESRCSYWECSGCGGDYQMDDVDHFNCISLPFQLVGE